VRGYSVVNWRTHWHAVATLCAGFLVLVLYRRSHLLAYLTYVATGSLHFILGARSAGGMLLAGAASCILKNAFYSERTSQSRRLRLASVAALVSIAAVGVGLFKGYEWAASTGKLGDVEQKRYVEQAGHELGVMGTGRGVFVYSAWLAFRDSPIIGHGSWPLDKEGYLLKACERFNIKAPADYYTKGYPVIPSHSHIMSAAMEHGIAGFIFYAYALMLCGRALIAPIRDSSTMQLWVLSVGLGMVWNTLFSPISYRMEYIATLVVFFDQMYNTAPSVAPWLRAAVGRKRLAPADAPFRPAAA